MIGYLSSSVAWVAFGVFALFVAISSVNLVYHWHKYVFKLETRRLVMTLYLSVTLILLSTLLISVILY